jgi:16S rRNA (adenine1518-N6/adenine1519-N6)-dimethyltransferase
MKEVVRQTRSYLMSLFQQHGINPRGDLGQNFLIDVNLIELAVRAADLGAADLALEIGSGTGGMTAFLAESAGHVISVDIDANMMKLAAEAVRDCANVTLVNQDVLKNKNTLSPELCSLIRERLAALRGGRLKLVANLPYSVATPVIANLIASDLPWERMVCTIQWELAEKMAAEQGGSGYGALSVWVQSQATIRILRRLGPNVFWPRPKVDSAIVSIWRDREAAARIQDRVFYLDFVRRLFTQRRKLVRGVVAGMYRKQLDKADVDTLLVAAGIPADARPEQLDTTSLIRLSNIVGTRVAAIMESHDRPVP